MPKPKSNITVVTDDRIRSCMLDILRDAKEEVVLISPYLALWGQLEEQIISALEREVDVTVLMRDPKDGHINRTTQDDIGWLFDQGVDVGLVECLHAKIYMNEEYLVVSSMHVTEASTKNARDIALVIKSEQDLLPIREYAQTLYGFATFPDDDDENEDEEQE
jgi:sugar-specific transcriptional regulator TrmB